jgi:hypothetical protein
VVEEDEGVAEEDEGVAVVSSHRHTTDIIRSYKISPKIYMAFLCQAKTSPVVGKIQFSFFRLQKYCLGKVFNALNFAFTRRFQT